MSSKKEEQQQQQEQETADDERADPSEPSKAEDPPADQEQSPKSFRHMDSLLNKIPNMAPEGPLGTQTKGPLSAVGDPLGQALCYGLKPLGHVTGAIGNPHGEALSRVQRVAAHEGIAEGEPKFLPNTDNGKRDAELPGGERIGGKEQTGSNPLGL